MYPLVRKIVFFVLLSIAWNAHAEPTGVLLDIFDMQADALKQASDKTIESLAGNALGNFENVYAIVDAEENFGGIDFNDKQCLTHTVDLIYEHPVIKSRLGLTSALGDISGAVEVESTLKTLYDVVGFATGVKEAYHEMSALLKGNKKAYVINNLLAYGGGKNVQKLEGLLAMTKAEGYVHATDFLGKLVELTDSAPGTVEDSFDLLTHMLKADAAEEYVENLKNGVWAKVTIQDFIVRKWRQQGIINDGNLAQFEAVNAYAKDTDGFIFKTPIVVTEAASNRYKLFSDAEMAGLDYSDSLHDANEFELTLNDQGSNTYRFGLPESILANKMHGVPVAVTFILDDAELFTNYPDAVIKRENFPETNIPINLWVDLKKYEATKKHVALEVSVSYSDASSFHAHAWLYFNPKINDLELVDMPKKWSSGTFDLAVKFCGDNVPDATFFFKNTAQNGYGNVRYRLSTPTDLGGGCKKYPVTLNGWGIYDYTGGNKDVSLSVAVADSESPLYTKYLLDENDTDNDKLPDK